MEPPTRKKSAEADQRDPPSPLGKGAKREPLMRIVAGFLLLTALLPGQQSSPISVCELLRDSDKYGGKIVTIRAYIHGGARHGYYLAENADEKQCSEMPNSKREWPPTVALRW